MSMVGSRPAFSPLRLVLMGVAGCGKSTVGQGLSAALKCPFTDGDDLHPAANIAKMARGEALDDADRWPWLAEVGKALAERGGIAAASALKRRYRDAIRAAAPGTIFVHLAGPPALIAARMAARRGHFMPRALLDSQFAALEALQPDEPGMAVQVGPPVADLVAEITRRLNDPGR